MKSSRVPTTPATWKRWRFWHWVISGMAGASMKPAGTPTWASRCGEPRPARTGWATGVLPGPPTRGQPVRRVAPGPSWLDDVVLPGRTILVQAEQGHGDTMQSLRYIPLLRQHAA